MTAGHETSHTPVVVAGLHGRPNDRMVVRWATHDARTRGARLRIVYAFETPVRYFAIGAAATPVRPPDRTDPRREEAQAIVDGAVEDARANAGDEVAVEGQAVEGSAARVLVAESKRADVIILGSPHHGAASFLGSVTGATAARAECPVLAVRGVSESAPTTGGSSPAGNTGPVVAGVGSGPLSEDVLRVAFDYARRYQVGLRAVMFWRTPPERTQHWLRSSTTSEREAATQRLSEILGSWLQRYPDVPVTQDVIQRSATDGIVEEAADASLLVVGAHGRHARLDRALGSVSQGVLHRASCPVAVVHRPEQRRPDDSSDPRATNSDVAPAPEGGGA